VVGGEDRAERGRDDVELPIRERERLGVGRDPLELHSMGLGLPAARLEVLGRQVRGHDLSPGLGGADRRVARTGGDVEHVLAGRDPARPDQHLPELPDRLLCEPVVVAERPGGAGGGLMLAVRVDGRRRLGFLVGRHLAPPIFLPPASANSSILASAAASIISRPAMARRSIAGTVGPGGLL
jgi:hypothetical protein